MFKFDYNKPGKGVNKRDPNQPRIQIYFELLGRKLWLLCKTNLLHFVTGLPFFFVTMVIMGVISSRIIDSSTPLLAELTGSDVSSADVAALAMTLDIFLRFILASAFTALFGLGPVTAGCTYLIRNYAREEHVWLFSDFFEHAKSNFKQSILVWIIDLAVFYIFTVAFSFYASLDGALSYINIFIMLIAVIYTMMHLYIYQVMITFRLSLKDVFRNSFIFAISEAPKNLLLTLITVAFHIIAPFMIIKYVSASYALIVFLILEVVLLFSFTSFTSNFFIYPSIEKYIKIAEKEHSSETNNL